MDWTISIMETLGYPGILLIIVLENLFPPIPSEVVLPFAGFMTTTGTVTFLGVVIASTLGSVIGAIALYWVGVWLGRDRIYRFVERWQRYLSITPKNVKQAEQWFEKYGNLTVLFCRMVPIMRSIISIPAGLVRMNLLTFSLYTLVGSVIWNVILIGVGALLGASWPLVTEWVGYYQDVVIVVGAVVGIAVVIWLFRKNRAARSN